MINYKQVEKIHPMVLFTIFVLSITAILPLFFFTPQPSTEQTFQVNAASGTINYRLTKTHIFLTFSVSSLNAYLFHNSNAIFHLSIIINSGSPQTFEFIIKNTSNFVLPYTFNQAINLTQNQSFSSSFQIKTQIQVFSGATVVNHFNSITTIGHSSQVVSDKWFIISFISLVIMWITPILYLKHKKEFSLISILKNYSKGLYESYETFMTQINDNSYFIMFFVPTLLLFVFLYRIYINFTSLTNSSLLFFNSKLFIIVILSLHALLISMSPTILNYILDHYKGNKLIRKNRIKDNMIFLPFLVAFYLLEFILVRVDQTKLMFVLLVVVAFIFNTFVYFQSLKYHSLKFDYHLSSKYLLTSAVGYRCIYAIVLFLTLQFFLFSSTSYPAYLLLI